MGQLRRGAARGQRFQRRPHRRQRVAELPRQVRLDARSKSARARWGFLVEAVRPKEVGRSFRELSLFAAGAGAATVVWFLVAQFAR